MCDLLADVLGIELLCGAQGLDFRIAGEFIGEDGNLEKGPNRRAGSGTTEVHRRIREIVTRWEDDRVMHTDLEILGAAVRKGLFEPPYVAPEE